jgi:phospholipase/carboxylesterase
MADLDGPRLAPRSGKAKHLVVFLHGYGADGNDLIGLAPVLAPLMPDVVFHAPNAPYPCEGNPMGFQWFGLARLDPGGRLAGVRSAAPFVETFLDETMAKYSLDETRTTLVGFSQGTMMALHVGLRRAAAPAAIVGYSGLFVVPETVAPEAFAAEIKSKPPVLLVHGDSDDLIPVQALFHATQTLAALGIPAEWHISQGVGHGIDQEGLRQGGEFLARFLKR